MYERYNDTIRKEQTELEAINAAVFRSSKAKTNEDESENDDDDAKNCPFKNSTRKKRHDKPFGGHYIQASLKGNSCCDSQ